MARPSNSVESSAQTSQSMTSESSQGWSPCVIRSKTGATADEEPFHVSKRRRGPGVDSSGRGKGDLSRNNYNFGWICALSIELAAARAMLDNIHETLPGGLNDSNSVDKS